MTKIPQSNYTQVPNVFFDEIMSCTESTGYESPE
jgi:hypothetical protein